MIWSCCYVAVCVFLIIYVTSWYTIDRRERETSYILGYLTSQITQLQGQSIHNSI
jgi:hypothetical protein